MSEDGDEALSTELASGQLGLQMKKSGHRRPCPRTQVFTTICNINYSLKVQHKSCRRKGTKGYYCSHSPLMLSQGHSHCAVPFKAPLVTFQTICPLKK